MEFSGIPFLEAQQVVFPEGRIDLTSGTLAELEKLFGQIGTIDPDLPDYSKHRLFLSQQGLVRAFFHPQEALESQSRVLTIDFLPAEEIPLLWFISFYKEDAKYLPCVPIEENKVLKIIAIFSLNLSLICELNSRLVESVSFSGSQHVQTCECNNCGLIRTVISQKHLLRPSQDK